MQIGGGTAGGLAQRRGSERENARAELAFARRMHCLSMVPSRLANAPSNRSGDVAAGKTSSTGPMPIALMIEAEMPH